MTKADIVNVVAQGTGLTKVETQAVIDGFLATVSYALQNGQRVDLRCFGKVKVVQRKERVARNPGTNEELRLPPYKAVVFRPSKDLKEFVNRNSVE